MQEETRASLTMGLWLFSALVLGALFISASMQGDLTPGHIALAFTILTLAVIGSAILLRWKSSETEAQREKSKRERIDSMLRDMSDEDLLKLKQRLSDGDYSEDSILDYLGDDGELVMRS